MVTILTDSIFESRDFTKSGLDPCSHETTHDLSACHGENGETKLVPVELRDTSEDGIIHMPYPRKDAKPLDGIAPNVDNATRNHNRRAE